MDTELLISSASAPYMAHIVTKRQPSEVSPYSSGQHDGMSINVSVPLKVGPLHTHKISFVGLLPMLYIFITKNQNQKMVNLSFIYGFPMIQYNAASKEKSVMCEHIDGLLTTI